MKLFVALPCYGDMPAQFAQCVTRLALAPPVSLQLRFGIGDSLVSRVRNTLTADFLASDATHLLFIDSDLVFSGDHIARLVSHGEPIVGGFYPKKKDGKLEWVCNSKLDFPPPDKRGLQELRYIGTGFLMVEREVFYKMIEHSPDMRYDADGSGRAEHDFWRVGVHQAEDGARRYLSEDWYFCQRALDLGISIFMDTRVVLKHIGQITYPLENPFAREPEPKVCPTCFERCQPDDLKCDECGHDLPV